MRASNRLLTTVEVSSSTITAGPRITAPGASAARSYIRDLDKLGAVRVEHGTAAGRLGT